MSRAASCCRPKNFHSLASISKPMSKRLAERIGEFAEERHLSRSMVAYSLLRGGFDLRRHVAHTDELGFRRNGAKAGTLSANVKRRARAKLLRCSPSSLGPALLQFVSRNMSEVR